MSHAKPIALGLTQVVGGGGNADEGLQGWQDEELGKKLIDPLFFGGSKLCNITPQGSHGLKPSPRIALQQPAAQPYPKGNKSGSMQAGSVSATATASVAARAQLETHAGLQQRLQQAYKATGAKVQLPLPKLNVGAEYTIDNNPGPDDWTIPAAVGPASSPKTTIQAEISTSSGAGTISGNSSRALLPGQLGGGPAAPAGGTVAVSKVPAAHRAVVPAGSQDTVQESAPSCTAQTSSTLAAPSAGDYSILEAANAAHTDAVGVLQVQQQQRPAKTLVAPTKPPPAAATAVLGRTRMADPQDAQTTPRVRTGQVIHYQTKVCAQVCAAGNESLSSISASGEYHGPELELELLECYGVGEGEMYLVRLLQDVVVPATAFRHHRHGKIPSSSSSSNTATGVAKTSEGSTGYVQYHRGQQFALKLRDREIPMVADRVSVLRNMMRKASCLAYAKHLKASLTAR